MLDRPPEHKAVLAPPETKGKTPTEATIGLRFLATGETFAFRILGYRYCPFCFVLMRYTARTKHGIVRTQFEGCRCEAPR